LQKKKETSFQQKKTINLYTDKTPSRTNDIQQYCIHLKTAVDDFASSWHSKNGSSKAKEMKNDNSKATKNIRALA
jgi:hypothetical protein